MGLSWTDTRGDRVYPVRVGRGSPPPIRQKSYVRGIAHGLVKNDIGSKGAQRGSMKLGSKHFQGQLYLTENDEPWELVSVKEAGDGKSLDIMSNVAHLIHFGVGKSRVESIGERAQLKLECSE
ncbi:unnamed protein product [Prorocentrum cordatum]|uniref:Uncharacterized protein n=1 Tax=Prorocentrum cordatum TaxID=2364126 RepID=A0ABN9QE19_9DINO|nr:unnamed protein product [Polarella glacialis]